MHNRVLLSALVGAAGVAARDIPSNVQTFYNTVKAQGACSNKLATGFYSKDDGPNSKSHNTRYHIHNCLTGPKPSRTAVTT